MMHLHIHANIYYDFINYLNSEVFVKLGERLDHGSLRANHEYHNIDVTTEKVTSELVKEAFYGFVEKNDFVGSSNVVDLPNGGLVLTGNVESLLKIALGYNTDRYSAEEPVWRTSVSDNLRNIKFNIPFVIDFNLTSSLNSVVPTVLLTGLETSKLRRDRDNRAEIVPVVYKDSANLIFMPNHMINAEELYDILNDTFWQDNYIVTPFCIIKRNNLGFGNVVFVKSVSFSTEKHEIVKSIFEELESPFIWEKILIPLATTDFDILRKEFEEQIIPMKLKLREFSILSQQTLNDKIMFLKSELDVAQQEINTFISEITSRKIRIDTMSTDLLEAKERRKNKILSAQFEKEIEAIKGLPYIEDIGFTAKEIIFKTKPIQVDEGPVLGGYNISYNFDTQGLEIKNMINPIQQLHHPHVPDVGEPCFGNYTDIYTNLSLGQYYMAIELLHQFLASYNPEDCWGIRLIYWDAQYVFEDMEERGLLHEIDSEFDEDYFDIYGEHLPNSNYCPECGLSQEECECNCCPHCHNHVDDCSCWICPECEELVEDGCECNRCENCLELVNDCSCERCDICGELLDINNWYHNHCECERCPDDYFTYVDDAKCEECENFDCEHNEGVEDEELTEPLF
jgi:hypothetical protein